MAKRSQKSRFGPGKDRIKPDMGDVLEAVCGDASGESSAASEVSNNGSPSESQSAKAPLSGNEAESGEDAQKDSEQSAMEADSDDELATGYTSVDDDRSPQTCCSNCHTVFEVSPDLLASSDTRVRCGECLSIFDALANLRHHQSVAQGGANEPEPENSDSRDTNRSGLESLSAESAGTSQLEPLATRENASPLDVTYADFSLFSADAGLREFDYLDETREIQPFDYDDLGEEDEFDQTIDETLYVEDVTEDPRAALGDSGEGSRVGGKAASAARLPGMAEQSAPAAATLDEIDEMLVSLQKPELPTMLDEEPLGAWWLRGLLFLGVLLLAAGLYGYRERSTLQYSPLVRPVLASVCAVFGCKLSEQVDLSALQVTKRTVFSHPDIKDTLIINIGFVNMASFRQPYPTLAIRLTDRNGTLIVERDFSPSDYLDSWQEDDVIDVDRRLDISLNLDDPGNRAMSFELDFK